MACSCGIQSKQKCKEIFDATLVKEFSDFRYAKVHRLTVDAYSLQHPDEYMVSPKSYAAHLTGMCCAMGYGNDRDLLRILQKWLNGKKQLQKPPLPENFGSLTISHIANAKDGAEHEKLVYEWALDAWNAYSGYHELAKDWIETAKRTFGRS
ncbi:MAG: DUF5946 family protein [bacterium]